MKFIRNILFRKEKIVSKDFDRATTGLAEEQANSRKLHEKLDIKSGRVDEAAVLAIIAQGIDPNMRFNDDDTLLIRAAFTANGKVVEALLKAGADPNLANNQQETALHYAALRLAPHAVDVLLQHGADIFAKTGTGSTVQGCVEKCYPPDFYDKQESNALWEDTRRLVNDAVMKRIKEDWDAALVREEVRNFASDGCPTSEDIKPMKRLLIKTPSTE